MMQNLKNSRLKSSYSNAPHKWIAASLALLAMTHAVLLYIITNFPPSLRTLDSKPHSSLSLRVLLSKAWQSTNTISHPKLAFYASSFWSKIYKKSLWYILIPAVFLINFILKNISLKKLILGGKWYNAAILFLLLSAQPSFSAPKQIEEVNYLASLRAAETNVRSGPGQNYPVKFTFKMRAIPVRVVSEYDNWNEIEDFEGQSGWVTQSLLTKKRTLLVRITKQFTKMYAKPNEKSRTLLQLENNVVGDFLKCEGAWCAMKVEGKKGWVKKADLFGA